MPARIRTNTLTGYVDLARATGLDAAALLSEVGLDLADLDVPDRWIPAAPAARLLDLSAQRSGREEFGLLMAERRHLGTLGPLAVVLRDEPDLRSAVDLLIRYERAYNEALHLRLRQTDGQATIEAWLELGEPAPRDASLDLVMGALLGILRGLVREDWEPLSASFTRAAPPDPAPWRRMFGAGVSFDRAFTGLVLAARDLDAPIVTSDPSLRPYTREFLRTVVTRPTVATALQLSDVVQALELLLPLGRGSIDQVGRYLGMRPGGLRRYLTDRGQTFSSVVHATRAQLAERYLPNEFYSLTDVSERLGFEAPSAFSRWFRQQFGTTPTEWRRAARAGAPPERRTVREG